MRYPRSDSKLRQYSPDNPHIGEYTKVYIRQELAWCSIPCKGQHPEWEACEWEKENYERLMQAEKEERSHKVRVVPEPVVSRVKMGIGGLEKMANVGLLGYEECTRAALTAVAAGEHVLMTGEPGTAKSAFTRTFFEMFDGTRLWSTQLTKSSDESQIFGIPNIQKLMNGEIEYAERIPALEADFWFVDEIFDAPDVTLRSVLSVLNEREFIRGSTPRKVKLHTCIATANYQRKNELTAAVIDRFVITVSAPVLTGAQRTKLYTWSGIPKSPVRLNLEHMKAVGEAAKGVKIPEYIVESLVNLAGKHGFSPRREVKVANMIRVYTAIRGESIVSIECLEPFKWALPIDMKEAERKTALQDLIGVVGQQGVEMGQLEELSVGSEWIDNKTPENLEKITKLLVATVKKGIKTAKVKRKFDKLYTEACKVYGTAEIDAALN